MRVPQTLRLIAIAFVFVLASGSGVLHAQNTGRLRLPVIDAVLDSGLARVSLTVKLVSDNAIDTTAAATTVVWQADRWVNAEGTALTEVTMPLGHVKDITNPSLKYELSYVIVWRLLQGTSAPTLRELKVKVRTAVRDGASMVVSAPFPGARYLYVVTLPIIEFGPTERVERLYLNVTARSDERSTLELGQPLPSLTWLSGEGRWVVGGSSSSSYERVRTTVNIRVDSAKLAGSTNPRLELRYRIEKKGQPASDLRQVMSLPPSRTAVLQAPPVSTAK